MDDDERRAIALFRFGVLGPLVSARLEHGDIVALCTQAAERSWVHPSGRVIRIAARTLESSDILTRFNGILTVGDGPELMFRST